MLTEPRRAAPAALEPTFSHVGGAARRSASRRPTSSATASSTAATSRCRRPCSFRGPKPSTSSRPRCRCSARAAGRPGRRHRHRVRQHRRHAGVRGARVPRGGHRRLGRGAGRGRAQRRAPRRGRSRRRSCRRRTSTASTGTFDLIAANPPYVREIDRAGLSPVGPARAGRGALRRRRRDARHRRRARRRRRASCGPAAGC